MTSPNPRENRWPHATGSPSVWNVTDAVELVPLDEDSYYQDPVGFFARLRESRPVAPVWIPDYGRVWIITRYADVRVALTDPRLVNKICHWPGGGRSFPDEAAGVHALLNTDPPEHTREPHEWPGVPARAPLLDQAIEPHRPARPTPALLGCAVAVVRAVLGHMVTWAQPGSCFSMWIRR